MNPTETTLAENIKDTIYKRINDSAFNEKQKKTLHKELNLFHSSTHHNQAFDKFFINQRNEKNFIIPYNLNAKQSRIQSSSVKPHESMIINIISKNINKKRKKIEDNKQKSGALNLSNFKLNGEDYTSDNLNEYNYSDFLNGTLEKHIRPKITLIVAYDNNYGIGLDGKLPWHIPEDLQWFKEKTSGKPVIMGRTNYDDITRITKGKGLPGRRNIVLSSKVNAAENFEFYQNIESILDSLKDEKEIFIIGGTMLYESFLPIADEVIATEIDKNFQTDKKFPHFKDKFVCLSTEKQTAVKKEQVELYFKRYVRTEPPSFEGMYHVNGDAISYKYNVYPQHHFVPDIFTNMLLQAPDLSFALLELIYNSPLPTQTLHTLLHYGEAIFNPELSIFSYIPDLFALSMDGPAPSLVDFFSFSNFSLDSLGNIEIVNDIIVPALDGTGEIIGNVVSGAGEIIAGIFGGL